MEILDNAFKAFDKMVEDDKSGVKPMYRSIDWNAEEKQKSKLNKKFNWWNSSKSNIQYKNM